MLPEPLAIKPPPLRDDLQEVVECFWGLSASRPLGFSGASGITTADILAMATAWDFEPTAFFRVIRQMDNVFLEHLHDKAKKSAK